MDSYAVDVGFYICKLANDLQAMQLLGRACTSQAYFGYLGIFLGIIFLGSVAKLLTPKKTNKSDNHDA